MREQIIQALAMALVGNQGNRLSSELINGIVQSVGQFALSLEAEEIKEDRNGTPDQPNTDRN